MDNNNESIDENNATSSLEIASSTSNNVIEDVLSPKVNPDVECNWIVGQLAWARVGNFPFWPCIVTFDPTTMTYHKLRSKFALFNFKFKLNTSFILNYTIKI